MRQIRFITPVEIVIDVPDTDDQGRDLTDDDAAIDYGTDRADAYLQTLTGEYGLTVAHVGRDALQDAEVIEPADSDDDEDSPIPERQQDILFSILLGRPYGDQPTKADVDWLITRFFVKREEGGLLTLTEFGAEAAEKIRRRVLGNASKSRCNCNPGGARIGLRHLYTCPLTGVVGA